MYGREYGGRTLRFEASGGLIHYSLVMQDKETDSYWSIMSGDSVAGELKGTRLEELPVGVKTQWKDWVAKHPDTRVLSVEGVEHEERNPYDDYFASEEGFRGSRAADDRLPTKTSIYSFKLGERAYAVPFAELSGGGTFDLGGREVFLFRPQDSAIFYSTLAFVSEIGGFEERQGRWHHVSSGAVFEPEKGRFTAVGAGTPERLDGFDTFWFNWSMNHPGTEILKRGGP